MPVLRSIQIWDSDRQTTIDNLKRDITGITGIVILAQVEASIFQISHDYWNQILNLSYHNKIPVYILISGHELNPNLIRSDVRLKYVQVIRWPLYWLTETLVRMGWYNNKKYNNELGNYFEKIESKTFSQTFICMNKRPKLHRFITMDMLQKYDLIDSNAVIWREEYTRNDYKLKYWNQKQIFLDQSDPDQLFIQEKLPKEYATSCLQLVTETEDDIFFLTEKTAVPLLFGKPFLVSSCYNYHKLLKEFGFQLYTEIFDYSFDSIENHVDRIDGLVQNFYRYKNYNSDQLSKLYDEVKDKVMYNRNLAFKYACDINSFPKIYNELATSGGDHISAINPHNMNIRLAELCNCIE